MNPARHCRVCGCSQNRACPGGCRWIENDLCSSCVGAALASHVLQWSMLFRDDQGNGPAPIWEAQLHDKNSRPIVVWFNEAERKIVVSDHLCVEIARLSGEGNYIAGHYTEAELIETFQRAFVQIDGFVLEQDEAA